ncbi:MAG TPA: thioredoxin family protein [Dissulfurispiraceae bacterium]|nr:thioredoxin family protein [Dissulfurispiraceae bacterium]
MISRRIIIAVLMFIVTFGVADAFSEIRWMMLKEGMEKARVEQKPVIVDFFYGKGCRRCEVLEKTVYGNAAIIQKVGDHFVAVRIDLTKKLSAEEEKLGKTYDFRDDCLLLFLDHTGEVMKDVSGKRLCFIDAVDPEWFDRYLDMVRDRDRR